MKLALAAHDSTNVATQYLLNNYGILCATLHEYYLDVMGKHGFLAKAHHVIGEVQKHNMEHNKLTSRKCWSCEKLLVLDKEYGQYCEWCGELQTY